MESDLTRSDISNIRSLLAGLEGHNSLGSYLMSALWVKGGKRIIGFNTLRRPAKTLFPVSNSYLGQHCEMDVVHQARPEQLRGGTLYVVGRAWKSGKLLNNTKPCDECSLIIEGVRKVVYFMAGEPIVEYL